MPIEVGYVPHACLPDLRANAGQFLAPGRSIGCGGTSAQVAGQRRSILPASGKGVRAGPSRTKRRHRYTPGALGSRPDDPRRGRIPGTATLRLRGNDFATIRSCCACCTGERAPANWRTREGWSPQSDKPTAGHRNPTSLQTEQDLSQREMSKELAEIRAKTSQLGEIMRLWRRTNSSVLTAAPLAVRHQRAVEVLVCEDRLGLFHRASAPVSAPWSLVFQRKGPYLPAFRARSSAVEHLTFNQVVVGSIPTGLTKCFQTVSAKSTLPLS